MTPDKHLNDLVREAKKTALYKELYKGIDDTSEFSKLPFLLPSYLKQVGPEYFAELNQALCVYFTSGTTSEPKAMYRSLGDIDYATEYVKWFCEIESIAGNERVAVFMDQSFWGVGYFTLTGHAKAGNAVIPIDNDLPKEVIADLIHASRPTVISSLPSVLIDFKDALTCPSVRVIETTGEPLTGEMRKEIEEHYNAEIYDAYGLTEGIVGVECSLHDGYHFNPDNVLLELIDAHTDNYGEQWGELILTVLNISPVPIIRYKTGDICRISYDTCSCGHSFPRIWIKGRKEHTILLAEGTRVPEKDIEDIIFDVCCTSVRYEINMHQNDSQAVLEITLDTENVKTDEIISRVQNLNYETLYLTKRNKLKVIIKTL